LVGIWKQIQLMNPAAKFKQVQLADMAISPAGEPSSRWPLHLAQTFSRLFPL
jgi:hypothetical protein